MERQKEEEKTRKGDKRETAGGIKRKLKRGSGRTRAASLEKPIEVERRARVFANFDTASTRCCRRPESFLARPSRKGGGTGREDYGGTKIMLSRRTAVGNPRIEHPTSLVLLLFIVHINWQKDWQGEVGNEAIGPEAYIC
ncbi:hypothetical protein IEQ34_020441 [Dendrobium chrysotoxum]|uniref:Uncharacterized protein n=1 Tax=Dendrobium chrysotoxum TaxID=161865 RepID=A0AAV7G2C9_DENCH|nr:hypothetical protein IEQ34_020441 [Dendrobium chrysotoxum]